MQGITCTVLMESRYSLSNNTYLFIQEDLVTAARQAGYNAVLVAFEKLSLKEQVQVRLLSL